MDSKQVGKIQMSLSRTRKAGGRGRYSGAVRATVSEWLRLGENPAAIAKKTGIGIQTLFRWSEAPVSEFRRVEVRPKCENEVTARLSNGIRISSPSLELMIRTLESLK